VNPLTCGRDLVESGASESAARKNLENEAPVYDLTPRPVTKSLKTPGFPRPVRVALAARSLRDERTVARWLRGEAVMPGAAAAIERAAAELGVVRP